MGRIFMTEKGKLYICGTPIGNLSDITLRALDVLKSVDLIACEDTRRTKILLNHYKIYTPLNSYHKHNEKKRTIELLQSLKKGKNIALVSDAGMPGVSDPGIKIIREVIKEKIDIIPIPGPTALISALVVSGFPMDRFVFEGFLPRKGWERREILNKIQNEERTIIFYESPFRIKNTLDELEPLLGDRKLAIVREISKIYEEKLYGNVEELLKILEEREIKGEIVVVIEGRDKDLEKEVWKELSIKEHLNLMIENGYSKKEAIKEVARMRDITKREVYKEAISIKK
jgi:16S rRNA (cytidine1402-2'-O)-methyltransferase